MGKKLNDILQDVDRLEIIGGTDIYIKGLSIDSRMIDPGFLFVAMRGTITDGHLFIEQACHKGAAAVLCEEIPEKPVHGVTYVKVNSSAGILGILASRFYDEPSRKIQLIGVTGTNGKTTITTLLYELFRKLGYKSGLISTAGYFIDDEKSEASHTTPDAVRLNALLDEMVRKGCEFCFMEVSSHAIHQLRTRGLHFKGAVFSNITHDHLDYHKDFKSYIKTKKLLFDELPPSAFALTNVDDKNGRIMIQNTNAKKYTYSLKSMSDYRVIIKEIHFEGMLLNVSGKEIWTRLTGEFNAYNILAVYATAEILKNDSFNILKGISGLSPVNGRFEMIHCKRGITAIVDYAHTPDALKNILDTIIKIKNRNQRVITVVGAGGNRDKSKRPEIARIAVNRSDKTILTSDNPRNENPEDIIQDMIKGIEGEAGNKTIHLSDRKEAIKTACLMAGVNDIILVAGKGHEKYQEIKGMKYPFDDVEVLKELLKD